MQVLIGCSTKIIIIGTYFLVWLGTGVILRSCCLCSVTLLTFSQPVFSQSIIQTCDIYSGNSKPNMETFVVAMNFATKQLASFVQYAAREIRTHNLYL